MIHIKPSDCIDIIRSLTYLLVAVESTLVSYNYNFGYMNMKRTPVIGSIRNVFICLSVLFFYMAFVPIVRVFNDEVYILLVIIIPIPLLVLTLHIRNFRHNSLAKSNKKGIIIKE